MAYPIVKGTTYATGNQVTATNLNNLVDQATFDSDVVDNVTLQVSGDQLSVKDNGITAAKLESASNGQLFIGNGAGFTKASLTAGAGTGIVNGSGSITLYTNLVATIAALKAITVTTLSTNYYVQVLGYTTANDGGGGLFYYDSSSSASDDGGITIAPNSGSGRWKRVHDTGFVSAAWFGNLSSTFATKVQSAIDYLSASSPYGGVVYVPRGSYSQAATITIKRGVTLKGAGIDATVIAQSAGAQIIIGAQGSTTYRAGFSDFQITAQNGATTPAVIFDRVSECFASRFLISGVDDTAIEFGTSANPTDASVCLLEEGRIYLDAASAEGIRIWGGGEITLNNVDVSGTVSSGQVAIHLGNTGTFDALNVNYSQITGDCDYGILCDGSANASNLRLTGVGIDRCIRGAVVLSPTSTAKIEDVILTGGYFSGTGATSGASEADVIVLFADTGTTITDITVSGALIKDGRLNGIGITGSGTISNVTINGCVIKDCGRDANNTHAGIQCTNSIEALTIVGCSISNVAATYDYCIEITAVGTIKPVVKDNLLANYATASTNMSTLASTNALSLLFSADGLVSITGTTDITSITALQRGTVVTLAFAGVLTFTDGGNLKLAGNFTTSADDTITLICDGTNWIEVCRSAN